MTNFQGKKIAIFGIQGSGKTHMAKWLVRKHFKKAIVYKVTEDWDNEQVFRYSPKNKIGEFEDFGKFVLRAAKEGKIDCVVIDEADMFFRTNYDLSPDWNELILMHRHLNIAIVLISRRPQDIPTRIVESCHHLFIFKIEGANVFKKFSEIHKDIPLMLSSLVYEQHNFIWKELGKNPVLHKEI